MPFLKEEKSEHERARWHELASQLVCARHCELPLSKMGSKGLFPVVAVPLAFFGTFFRFERKYFPLRGGSPIIRAVVGASVSTRGKGYAPAGSPKGFSLVLWKPSGTEAGENPMGHQIPLPSQSRRTKPPAANLLTA